ncbi:hypothetical protein LR48_Vigan04g134100 [Vigna angularis]|uniref:Uncharacterized protein n=1 Tax=Phaseolus angularis TaxID=3914 RepID=A0A0L9UEH3_PHAAN|nr:hypothetical protein LR48_Vigan04g134100 [Vigna angularis]
MKVDASPLRDFANAAETPPLQCRDATAVGPRLRHHLAATSSCLANATAATAAGRPCRYSPPPHRDLTATSLRSRCGLVAFSLPPPALNDAASIVSPPPLSRRSSPSFASFPATSIDASSAVSSPPLSRRSSPRRSLPPPPPQSTLPPPFLLVLCRVVRPRAVRFLPSHLNRRFLRRFSSSSVASSPPVRHAPLFLCHRRLQGLPLQVPPPDLGLAVVWFSCGKGRWRRSEQGLRER